MQEYSKLVAALRCKRDDCEGCGLAFFDKDEGWMRQYAAKDDDAADAIEALQAQLPKRGEWIVKGANRIDCSVCGHSICFASVLSKGSLTGYNYCPRCGAKMEVQDGSY